MDPLLNKTWLRKACTDYRRKGLHRLFAVAHSTVGHNNIFKIGKCASATHIAAVSIDIYWLIDLKHLKDGGALAHNAVVFSWRVD